MTISNSLQTVTDFIEQVETANIVIESVSLTHGDAELETARVLSMELKARLPGFTEIDLFNEIHVESSTPPICDNGAVPIEATVHVPLANSNGEPSSSTSQESQSSATETAEADTRAPTPVDGQALPAYQDPAKLRAVYEEYDTFKAMTEALAVDVTPETVRRYMIEHGIHTPNPKNSDTGSNAPNAEGAPVDEGTETQVSNGQVAANNDTPGTGDARRGARAPSTSTDWQDNLNLPTDVDLPRDLTLDELAETISKANTVYEIQQQVDMREDDIRQLLKDLELYEYIMGRLSTVDERQVSVDEIHTRLRSKISG